MHKYCYLGVNSTSGQCCQLFCLLPFDMLVPDKIEASDFSHSATNWGGRDQMERTLRLTKTKQTGRKICLYRKITFFGDDYDWGRTMPWAFEVDEIHELTGVEDHV